MRSHARCALLVYRSMLVKAAHFVRENCGAYRATLQCNRIYLWLRALFSACQVWKTSLLTLCFCLGSGALGDNWNSPPSSTAVPAAWPSSVVHRLLSG